jgi:hypothetical protein
VSAYVFASFNRWKGRFNLKADASIKIGDLHIALIICFPCGRTAKADPELKLMCAWVPARSRHAFIFSTFYYWPR